jgi:hypothetical protein
VRRAILVLVAAAVVLAGAAVAGTRSHATQGYAYGERGHAPQLVARAGQAPAGFTGGAIRASDGETVNVYVDDALLAADPSAAQHWADALVALLHGSEISNVTIYMATIDRIREICGSGALGCYGNGRLAAIGQDLDEVSTLSVLTHEYGHHVANSRTNDPWKAVDWGTKRWASYLDICARTQSGQLFPGDENRYYQLNPGEVFAEDYRVLNERREGLPESAWQVVDQSLYPDQTALDLLAQDVTQPWSSNTTNTYRVAIGSRASGRGFRISTPLDGSFVATLKVPAKARLALRVVDPASGKVLAAAPAALRVQSLPVSVCGQRTLQLQVKRVSGAGTFTLDVSNP